MAEMPVLVTDLGWHCTSICTSSAGGFPHLSMGLLVYCFIECNSLSQKKLALLGDAACLGESCLLCTVAS